MEEETKGAATEIGMAALAEGDGASGTALSIFDGLKTALKDILRHLPPPEMDERSRLRVCTRLRAEYSCPGGSITTKYSLFSSSLCFAKKFSPSKEMQLFSTSVGVASRAGAEAT